MDISAATLIGIFDRVGIVAFAYSGVVVGMRRRLDVFGLLVMGIVTATGGGVLRDVLLARVPFLLTREDYLVLAAASSLIAIPLVTSRVGWLHFVFAPMDAVGLGAFAVAGALAAIRADLGVGAAIVLAILTATGGGVLRDLFADQVPMVLRAEVNASAAAVGGVVVWLLEPSDAGLAAVAGALATAGVRLVTRMFGIALPVPVDRQHDDAADDAPA